MSNSYELEDPDIMYNSNPKITKKKKGKFKKQNGCDKKKQIKEIFPLIDDKSIDLALSSAKGDLNEAIIILAAQPKPAIIKQIEDKLNGLDKVILQNSNIPTTEQWDEDSYFGFFCDEGSNSIPIDRDDYDTKVYQLQHFLEDIMEGDEIEKIMQECSEGIEGWMRAQGLAVNQSLFYDPDEPPDAQYLEKIQEFIVKHIEYERGIKMERPYDQDSQEDFPSLPKTQQKDQPRKNSDKVVLGFHFNSQTRIGQQTKQSKSDPKEIYAVNNSGTLSVERLCQEFPQVTLNSIKEAYNFIGDYFLTKSFLMQSFPSEYQEQRVGYQQNQSQGQFQDPSWIEVQPKKQKISVSQKKDLNTKYQEIRDQLNEINFQRYMLQRCLNNHTQFKNQHKLRSHISSYQFKLDKLYDESHILFIAILQQRDFITQIDLHGKYSFPQLYNQGFFGDEIERLLEKIIQQIDMSRPISLIVGRGLHSKNNKQVLNPIVIQFFSNRSYTIEQQPGKVIVKQKGK